jgi:hypothetical protein
VEKVQNAELNFEDSSEDDYEEKEEFYTVGVDDLKVARRQILNYSINQ